ncbi:sensor histidine kinase [Hamadaea sp.]|uniref:sensor histidine kinase n=1 Tax=Hamadaea sp. TaxID=2024425 RepID=UPI0025C6E7AF|nr:sensor histidine kinase [Hamadaea sp.]
MPRLGGRRGLRWWPRALAYLLSSPPVMLTVAVPLGVLGLPWLMLLTEVGRSSFARIVLLGLVGLLLVAGFGPLIARPVAAVERWRLRLADPRPVPSPRSGPARPPWLDPVAWREFAYAILLVTVLPALYLLASMSVLLALLWIAAPLLAEEQPVSLGFGEVSSAAGALPYTVAGILLLPVTAYLLLILADGHVALAGALLGGDSRDQLVEIARSRSRLADAFEAERRRIERDLHDGAQQRLIGLTLQLGLARHDLPPESPAGQAVAAAHEQAKQLMGELRDLIQGIRPQILTDRGLPAALRELADRSPIGVRVDATVPERLPAQVETTAYFVAAEALANVAKHAEASQAAVEATVRNGQLTLVVTDDGVGGADPVVGSGLTGLADRVGAIGGTTFLSSPPGGPTVLKAEMPCG